MAPKLFMTGITGYIGGSVFATIAKKHPEYDVTAYVRTIPKDFSAKYPNVKLVHGNWDDAETLKKAASESDIVVHCGDSDHLGAVTALLDGALEGAKKRHGTAFYIHLGGTGTLSDYKDANGKEYRGKLNPKVYSDIDSIDEITSRPDGSLHRHTDKVIQQYGEKYAKEGLRTAIMCPPDIYGRGHGPVKTESVYFPVFVNEIKKLGYAFYYGEGENTRGWVHIDDLMKVYVKVIEAAAEGGANVTWGREGYFFATSQEATQKNLAAAAGKVLHARGVIDSATPKQVGGDVIAASMAARAEDLGYYMFANNSRVTPDRSKKELGYSPSAPSLWDTIESDIDDALKKA